MIIFVVAHKKLMEKVMCHLVRARNGASCHEGHYRLVIMLSMEVPLGG